MSIRRILALDIGTGPQGSGVVAIETSATDREPVCAENTEVKGAWLMANEDLLRTVSPWGIWWPRQDATGRSPAVPWHPGSADVVFEGVASWSHGKSLDRTNLWIGRIWQALVAHGPKMVLRATVRAHLCASSKAGDAEVGRALRDRFGGYGASWSDVKGTKDNPGPLYGMKKDMWAALAVAVAYVEGARLELPFGE